MLGLLCVLVGSAVGLLLLAALRFLLVPTGFLIPAEAGEKLEVAWLQLRLGLLAQIAREIALTEKQIEEAEGGG